MRTRVLSGPEKMEVAKLYGWYWTPIEIHKHVTEQMGKKISYNSIVMLRDREEWKPIIEKCREDYNKVFVDVPLANKKKRVVELQKHYDLHMEDGNLREAQGVIKDIKDEMDEKFGDVSFHFTQINQTQFRDMSDEDLLKEKAKTLDEFERVKKMRHLLEGGKNVGSKAVQTIQEIEETGQKEIKRDE